MAHLVEILQRRRCPGNIQALGDAEKPLRTKCTVGILADKKCMQHDVMIETHNMTKRTRWHAWASAEAAAGEDEFPSCNLKTRMSSLKN